MIEAMRRGQIDVGYFGPLSYVLLKQRMPGATAFAAKLEGTSPTYTAVLIAGADIGRLAGPRTSGARRSPSATRPRRRAT